jgi:ribosomal protein L40E
VYGIELKGGLDRIRFTAMSDGSHNPIEATSQIERLERDGTSMAQCKRCGAEVTPGAESCGSCGVRFKGSSNLWLLVLVAIVFGVVAGTILANFLNR